MRKCRNTPRPGRAAIAAAAVGMTLLLGPAAVAAPAAPTPPPPPEAPQCQLLDALAELAGAIEVTVEASAGSAIDADLRAAVAGTAPSLDCPSGGPTAPGEPSVPGRPTAPEMPAPAEPRAEACSMLREVSVLADSLARAAEARAGRSLPVDPGGSIRDLAEKVGCGDALPTPPAPRLPSGDPKAQACSLLDALGSTASAVGAAAEARAGRQLPFDPADVIADLAGRAGCGGGEATRPDAELPSPPPGTFPAGEVRTAACGLLDQLSSTATTVEAAVESASGRSLSVDLGATVDQLAGDVSCAGTGDGIDLPSGAPTPGGAPLPGGGSGGGSGDGGPTGPAAPSGNGRVAADAAGTRGGASVLGTQATRSGTLPRTGGTLPYGALGTALLGLAALAAAARRRLAPPA